MVIILCDDSTVCDEADDSLPQKHTMIDIADEDDLN